jgi:outer membrane biosynthesis protein TonB
MDEFDTEQDQLAEEEHSLRQKMEQSERAMQELEGELRSVDAELGELADKGHEFELLANVCRSLEELETNGANHLFWDDEIDAAGRLDSARRKMDEYSDSIRDVEERRLAIVDKIGEQNAQLDYLHYDLTDAIERMERRQAEWVVERDDEEAVPLHIQVMPWSRGYEEDQRFRKSLGSSLAASLLVAIILSSIALPIVERTRVTELPERVARLVRELPPPPPPVEQPPVEEELNEPEPEPEEPEQLAEEVPPPEEVVPESTETPAAAAAEPDAREQVKSKGILAFRDSFASRANLRPDTDLGSQARVRSAGEDAVGRPERAMVTTNAPGSSGGINLADISRDVGGGGGQGLGGVQVSRVASSIGGGGTADRPLAGGAMAGRTDEEIQIVFDRYKAALYRLYNRELRKNPTLRGQIVLRLTIEPDGSVSFCVLQSSDMDAPVLADQVVERVRTFDFGAKEDIAAVTIIYPIDFLPAA